jgi:hypothetical protein
MVRLGFYKEEHHGQLIYPLTHYAQVKHNYCLAYFGHMKEFLVQLKALKPIIENQFKGIKLFLACRDDFMPSLTGISNVVKQSEIGKIKTQFAYIRELTTDLIKHPVLELLLESKIEIPSNAFPVCRTGNKCVIITKGNCPPTSPLTQIQIQKAIALAASKGYEAMIDKEIEDASWVIGVESDNLYQAGIWGAKTSLIPTGIGTELYKKMFPAGTILCL